MGCLHIHLRKGKILKVSTHDFQLQNKHEQDGVLHLEDNKNINFFDFKTFEKNHAIDREELSDVPQSDRYDNALNEEGFVDGISLCPKCEKAIQHHFKLDGAHFIGLQSFHILKKCYECKTSWVAEIKVLIGYIPTYHVVEGKLVPDESTARQDFLNALQESIRTKNEHS